MNWIDIVKAKDIFDADDTEDEDTSGPRKPRYRDFLEDEVIEELNSATDRDQVGIVREQKPNKDMCDGFPGCRKISELKCTACGSSYCKRCYKKFESGHPPEKYNLGDNDDDDDPELE